MVQVQIVNLVIDVHILLVHVLLVQVVVERVVRVRVAEHQLVLVLDVGLPGVGGVTGATTLVFGLRAINWIEAHYLVVVVA